ncbi:MAG TPA: histidine phosphatase family protein [Polyangiaceae bacterium]|nr:histidine phosphatase family protein [Polyangiaceae bacterium]
MRRTIYLARHGETDWNRERRWQGHTDVALNEAGRKQARELAEALRDRGLTHVSASDLSRARETAEIVASTLGIPAVSIDARLRERAFGVFEGLTQDECLERYPEQWASYRSDLRRPPPGAEEYEAVAQRMHEAVSSLAGNSGEQPSASVIVSHGGAMRAFLMAVTGSLPPPLHNGATFRLHWEGGSFRDIERVR